MTRRKNATQRERKDRIRVYPCVILRCDERQREGDATQRKPLRHILNRALQL